MILNKNHQFFLYLFCIISLIFSFILEENSSGGSKLDNEITRQFIDGFLINYNYGFKYFINSGQVQSPIFYIIIAFIEKNLGEAFYKYIYILISSIIPLIFYISLKKNFKNSNKNILFLLSLIIFLSPYFRSSAVWTTTDNFAILFFVLSINKYLSLNKKNNNKNLLLCIFYISAAVYIRQYYFIFFIFYFFKFIKKLNLKKIFKLCILLLIIFAPFLGYYYYFFKINIIHLNTSNNPFSLNLINNLLIFLSLYFFYTIPFYLNSFNEVKKIFLINYSKLILILFIFLLIYVYFPYLSNFLGGGIFAKISDLLNNKFIFLISSFIGSILLLQNFNKHNQILYICLILAFPTVIVYQKYYDPLIILTILTLSKNGMINKIIESNKVNIVMIYLYFLSFLIISNIYYTIKI